MHAGQLDALVQGFRAPARLNHQIGPNPGALLFVNSATRNTYPVIRGIDQLAGRNALMGFKSFTIYLTADRTAAENRVRLRNGLATGGHKFSVTGKFGALKLENPIKLSKMPMGMSGHKTA